MNVFDLPNQLIQNYSSYISIFIQFQDEHIRKYVNQQLSEGLVWLDLLDPQGYAARVEASDFHVETFWVLKEKEIKDYGQYHTRRLVLEAWDWLEGVEVGNSDGFLTGTHQHEAGKGTASRGDLDPSGEERRQAGIPTKGSTSASKEGASGRGEPRSAIILRLWAV